MHKGTARGLGSEKAVLGSQAGHSPVGLLGAGDPGAPEVAASIGDWGPG